MRRRRVLALLGLGGLGLATRPLNPGWLDRTIQQGRRKNWAWLATDLNRSTDDWKRLFATMAESGIHAVLPEIYNSRQAFFHTTRLPLQRDWLSELLPLTSSAGLETHAWMWSMPCNIEEIRKKHPAWFMVNRNGVSASEKPAYVDYYRFLCPSHPEVREFLKSTVAELSGIDAIAGVHFDYIRYPDVILAEGIQPRYGIIQDREYPQYDYCYCDLCRAEFKRESAVDPLTLDDPAGNAEWNQFRYDRISRLVNDTLIPVARAGRKFVSAAVFPNWRNVRQEWARWEADAVMPMLYHPLYRKGPDWIREMTVEGVSSLKGQIPLYSGLLIPRLSQEEFAAALEAALAGGASGVALFHGRGMSDEHWMTFRRIMTE